ncbi:MAG: response regulator [Patescibacteria group bacterium]|nr:response regulator [Patescibacteria group bacterium]MDD4611246.1 response regulator [Patescibacteria group bacterium]
MNKNKKYKLLIVEDENTIRTMYTAKFESDGFEIVSADNGVTGLEMAKTEKPDLILLDIILPQLDGFTILKSLKEDKATENIPVVMLTNLGTNEDKIKGQEMGALDYIVKASLSPAEISEKIKQYLK